MAKLKMIMVRVTEDQDKFLQEKARSAGFIKKSDYIRFSLFSSLTVEDKIDKIYSKVCQNG